MNVREEVESITPCPPGWSVLWKDFDGTGEITAEPIAAIALVRVTYPPSQRVAPFHTFVPVVAGDGGCFDLANAPGYIGVIGPDGNRGPFPPSHFAGLGGMDTPL
jgi:hypothetical protein